MRKLVLVYCLLAALMFLSVPNAAYAATDGDATATVTIDFICDIWFHPDGDLVFDNIDFSDYDNGYTSHGSEDYSFEVQWDANFDWWLWIRGGEQFFLHDNVISTKECSDIEFLDGGGIPYTPLPLPTELKFLLANGSPGTYAGNPDDFSMNLMFQVALTWGLDTPGVWYYDTITFTLTNTG